MAAVRRHERADVRRLGHLARSSTPRRSPRRSPRHRGGNPEGDVQKEEAVVVDAVVTQALPNTMFEVELENSHKFIAYAAGRLRRYRIRITPGDRIRVELSPYDLNRGRVVYRYRD
jgi:translation initiation factor IF-1